MERGESDHPAIISQKISWVRKWGTDSSCAEMGSTSSNRISDLFVLTGSCESSYDDSLETLPASLEALWPIGRFAILPSAGHFVTQQVLLLCFVTGCQSHRARSGNRTIARSSPLCRDRLVKNRKTAAKAVPPRCADSHISWTSFWGAGQPDRRRADAPRCGPSWSSNAQKQLRKNFYGPQSTRFVVNPIHSSSRS